MHVLTSVYQVLRETVMGFNADKGFKHGAAISYYTIFSLPAILMIIIYSAGSLLGEAMVRDELLTLITDYLGPESATEIDVMIANINQEKSSTWATIIGIGTLIFGATGVFYTLQDSINSIWRIPQKIDKITGIASFVKLVIDRALSLTMVFTLSFILLVSMILDAVIVGINQLIENLEYRLIEMLTDAWPWFAEFLQDIDVIFLVAYSLDIIVGLVITSLVFAFIFRFLPSARVPWRDVWLGALFTAILFTLGKTGISWYLANSSVSSTYGAAGSVVVILLWVFFSSQILLLGAEFILAYSKSQGREIVPALYVLSIVDQPLYFLKYWWRKLSRRSKSQAVDVEPEEKEETRIH